MVLAITGGSPDAASFAQSQWARFSAGGPTSKTEVTVQPAVLVARTNSQANQALGQPLPIVVGTGRVDGVYFIGGVEQISTVTTTTSTQTIPPSGNVVVVGSNPGAASMAASQWGRRAATQTTTSSSTDIQTQTMAGYVLAYDVFERGYDLIRVEVDGDVVYDSEIGISATQTLRFYGGRHIAADPILTEMIGANAGAYHNFVMLFLDGYPADSPPSVSCVISNGTTDFGETQRIEWTGATPNTFADPVAYGESYDPADGVIYHILEQDDVSAGAYQLAVLDIDTHLERYRVPLADSGAYYASSGRPQIMALRGTGHVLAELHMASSPGPLNAVDRIYDAVTGAIVAEHAAPGTEEITWTAGLPFGEKHVFMGFNRHTGENQQIHFGVADIAAGTFTVEEGTIGFDGPPAWGRQGGGSVSFYSKKYGVETEVYEHTFNGDTWTTALVYAAANPIRGLHFDPETGYLVVTSIVLATTTGHVDYVNPLTGVASASFDPGFFLLNYMPFTGFERFWARPGFALFKSDGGFIRLLNIRDKTLSIFTDNVAVADQWTGVIFDHNRRSYYSFFGDNWWTEYRLPGTAPRLLDLDDVVTDVMYLAGFGPPDLAFEGFTGIQTWGFVIGSNTTIQNAVRPLADTYGFAWADTGSGFYFKKAGQGSLLAVDVTFDTADLVERDPPVQTSDEANIRTPSAVEMEYQSKEGVYKPRPTSFSMTTGVLNSITTPRFSTPILLNDAEAQRIVTEKFFEYQENRRGHSLVVAPEHIAALPGDIVSFPSGTITYTAQIEQVAIDLRNMGVEISARDFQTEVATTVTAVSNNLVSVQVYFATQYLHLDMPLFRYADDTAGASLVQYGVVAPRGQTAWSGGTLYRGPLATATLIAIFNQSPHAGIVGVCTSALAPPLDPFALDDTSAVTIRRVTADPSTSSGLVDATEAEVLAGANNALIGIDGRWEWVGFKSVVDNLDGTYTLSGFTLRGYRGTEVFCDRHEAGDVFVTIDPVWLKKANHPVDDLGDTLYYLAAGIGQNPAVSAAKPHVITGAAETPYACVNLDATVAAPNGIDLAWDYRSRIATGLNPANHGEAELSFEIDIYDGATYKRTLAATTNAVHYATADVVADFGADPPDDFTFMVFMMSALPILVAGQERPVEGRGYEARKHVNLAGSDVNVTGQAIVVSVGTVTVTAVDSGGGGGELPDGAIAHLDFVNGFYYAGGSERAVTVLLGDPADTTEAGGGFEEGAIFPGDGMLISRPGHSTPTVSWTNRPAAIGPLYTDLAAAVSGGGTLVFDLNFLGSCDGDLIDFFDAGRWQLTTADGIRFRGGSGALRDGIDISVGHAFGGSARAVKAAITINRNIGGSNREYAWSADGEAAATDTATYTTPFPTTSLTTILIGHDGEDNSLTMASDCYYRTITLYPAKLPSELAALTAGPAVNVTANVTGQAVAASVGTVTVSTSAAVNVTANVTGQAVAASVGTVTVSTAAGDPYWSSVKLLCGSNGTDGATTFVDESPVARTLTAVGNAQIDTAQFKFGTSSMLLDGTGDYVAAPDSADWDFGTGQFTIEGWFRFAVTPANATLLEQWPGGWAFWFFNGKLYLTSPSLDTTMYTWAPTLNTWYHIAIDRDASSVARIYVDGAMVSKSTGYTPNLTGSTANMQVGSLRPGFAGYDLNGWVDEIRITKGVARYASDSGFAVPTAAFPRTGSGGGGTWQTNASQSPTGTSSGWVGYTLRQRIEAAGLANAGGTQVRVTLKAGVAGGFVLSACYIGAAAPTGDVYDFATTPTQLLFSGSGSVGVAANASVVSDAAVYSVDITKPLVVSMHFNGVSSVSTLVSATNWQCYYIAANEAGTVNATSTYATGNAVYAVANIESLI